MKRTKLIFPMILTMLLFFCFAGCKKNSNSPKETDNTSDLLSGQYQVEIEVENYGVISLTLDADAAPITVTNFVGLVKDGFYNGLTFHRIMSGFMIQGGDPNGNGSGGSPKKIKGEFAINGIKNPISHTRGTISMARRSGVNDSASSQFFIMQADNTGLDGQYAAFGHVTNGMEVVDAICAGVTPIDDIGTILPVDQPVIKEIRMVE